MIIYGHHMGANMGDAPSTPVTVRGSNRGLSLGISVAGDPLASKVGKALRTTAARVTLELVERFRRGLPREPVCSNVKRTRRRLRPLKGFEE